MRSEAAAYADATKVSVFGAHSAEHAADWIRSCVAADAGDGPLFRGQANAWRLPRPSLWRLSHHTREEAKQRTSVFAQWLATRRNVDEPEALLAVAQHYGFATNLLDVTTDAATAIAFAAAEPSLGDRGVLITFRGQLERYSTHLRALFPGQPPAFRLIEPNVPGLWRMHQQRACAIAFGEEPPDVHDVWVGNLFPILVYWRDRQPRSSRALYPEQRSDLEIDIDHFLLSETASKGRAQLAAFAEELQESRPGEVGIFKFSRTPDHELLAKAHPSWGNARPLAQADAAGLNHVLVRVPLADTEEREALLRRAEGAVATALEHPHLDVLVAFAPDIDAPWARRLCQLLADLWDGAVACCASREARERAYRWLFALLREAYEIAPLPEAVVVVEMRERDGEKTRSVAPERALREALRDDLESVVDTSSFRSPDGMLDIFELLRACNAPQALFDFEKLRQCFFAAFCPSQLVSGDRRALIIDPFRLETLGVP